MFYRACAGCVFYGIAAIAFAQTADRALIPGSTLTEKLAGGESRAYRLNLPQDQTFEISIIEQQGMAGVVAMLAPDGTEISEAYLSRRSPAAKALLIPPGAAQVVIRPANHSPVERVFEIRTGQSRMATEQDRLRVEADRLLGQGEHAIMHKTPGFREAALDDYEKSLDIWTRVSDRLREADALCHIGSLRFDMADMKNATQSYQRALDLSEAENDPESKAEALYGKALVAHDSGSLEDAGKWAQQALDIRRSLNDLHGQIEILVVLFEAQYVRGKRDEARATGNLELSLSQQTGDRIGEADAWNALGVLESQLGNSTAAVEDYQRSLAIAREEEDPVRTATGLSNLASGYAELGDYREAVRAFDEALPIRKMFASPSSYANTLYNVSVVRTTLGEYEKALDGFREALNIFEQSHFARGEGFASLQIGQLYLSTGEDDKAEEFLRQAVAKWRSISDRNDEVKAMETLGTLALDRREVSKASGVLNEALSIARTAGLQREEDRTLTLLARAELASGNAHAALDHATAARQLAAKLPDQVGEADAAYEQGAAWSKLGNPGNARDALETALAMHKQTQRKPKELLDLEELAKVDRDRARTDEALALLDSLGPSESRVESRMSFSAAHRDLFDLAIQLHMQAGDTAGAFELSERARARGLATLLREPAVNIREGVDPALLAKERDLESSMDRKQERLAQMLAGAHDAAREKTARAELDRVVSQYRDLEVQIRKSSPRYASLIAPRTLSVAETQAELPDAATGLIEFWLGEEHSYAWLVTTKSIEGFQLPARESIEALAKRAYAAVDARNDDREESSTARTQRIAEADREFEQTMVELSRILLGPIHGLSSLHRLWVVSDGALEYLPIAALPVPGTHSPLVAAHQIVRLPSASVLAEIRSETSNRPPAPLSVAVFADPVFRADDERVSKVADGHAFDQPRAAADVDLFNLPRLYFSRQEADAIHALSSGQKARELLDFDASRAEAEKLSLRDFRVVHFATHALIDSKNPELSGLVLSMIDRQGRPQDGFLRLHDLYNLKLNADLVVLSACRTALGQQVQSEGLIGLTRGFMYAGAPQVLASLWSIRDNATTWFMTKFYEALLDRHQTPEAALRTAQLAMLKDAHWNHPYYWAAFAVQGAH